MERKKQSRLTQFFVLAVMICLSLFILYRIFHSEPTPQVFRDPMQYYPPQYSDRQRASKEDLTTWSYLSTEASKITEPFRTDNPPPGFFDKGTVEKPTGPRIVHISHVIKDDVLIIWESGGNEESKMSYAVAEAMIDRYGYRYRFKDLPSLNYQIYCGSISESDERILRVIESYLDDDDMMEIFAIRKRTTAYFYPRVMFSPVEGGTVFTGCDE